METKGYDMEYSTSFYDEVIFLRRNGIRYVWVYRNDEGISVWKYRKNRELWLALADMYKNKKYEIIKKVVDTDGNKQRAAIELGCSKRHVNRMIKGYKEKGKEFFLHGNRGRKPAHALNDNTRKLIVDLYRTKYFDANITHYSELLKSRENINVSPSTIRAALLEQYILSPKARKKTKKKLNNYLNELKIKSNSKKEIKSIQSAII